MKLHKPLADMTREEAFNYLQGAAIALIRGEDDLPPEVKKWLGLGILAMCGDHTVKLNEAFNVRKVKKVDQAIHASRYGRIEFLRSKKAMTRALAIEEVARCECLSIEAISSSWKIQHKLQIKNKNERY